MTGNIAAMGHAPASDGVVTNSLANFAYEHDEIARCRALIALTQAVAAEEERRAGWIGQRIEQVMLEHAQREESGQMAGVQRFRSGRGACYSSGTSP